MKHSHRHKFQCLHQHADCFVLLTVLNLRMLINVNLQSDHIILCSKRIGLTGETD